MPKAAPRSFYFGTTAAGALLFCATFIAYLPALRGGFVWDDDAHVTKPALRSLDGLRRIWFEVGATQQYYPFLHSAFWLEHRLWGDSVVGYHLANILLHATAACLVVAVMRRLALPGAWLAGFIFALHPVNVESVAWISEQKNTLSAVFCLGAAFAYLGFDRDRKPAHYALALGLFILALLTKTVTATLPAALLVILFWRRRRIAWRRDVLPLIPWLALGLAAGLFTAWVERHFVGAEGKGYLLSWPDRFVLSGRVIWFYLAKLAWPANLMFVYPHWEVDASRGSQWVYLVAALALVAGLWALSVRSQGRLRSAAAAGLAGFLIFAGTLFPVLGFVNVYPFVFSYVADHFQYLASLGVIVPLSAGLALAAGRLAAGGRTLALGAAGILLVALGALTWVQGGIYRDVQTLYLATLARNPDCWMAHANLGLAWSQVPGRLDDAIAQYEEALRIYPDNAEAHHNLGNAFSRIPGRLDDAITEYEEAIRLNPRFAKAHNNLGSAWARMPGRLDDAIAQYREALSLDPNDAQAHFNLGNAWAQAPGRLGDAVAEYQEAIRISPDFAQAHENLGNAWVQTPGRLGDAVTEYQEALRISPNDAAAHFNLGNAWARMPGRLEDAIGQYEEALRLRPDFAPVWRNLGVARFQSGDLPAAAAAFREELRLTPDDMGAQRALADVLQQEAGGR